MTAGLLHFISPPCQVFFPLFFCPILSPMLKSWRCWNKDNKWYSPCNTLVPGSDLDPPAWTFCLLPPQSKRFKQSLNNPVAHEHDPWPEQQHFPWCIKKGRGPENARCCTCASYSGTQNLHYHPAVLWKCHAIQWLNEQCGALPQSGLFIFISELVLCGL